MLKDRILATLKFFDLQDIPLTLLELHRYLVGDVGSIRSRLNGRYELTAPGEPELPVSLAELLACLEQECRDTLESDQGHYCLKGRRDIIARRLSNYLYGIKRERRIRRFLGGLAHVPFVRGVAIGGSQALGQQKKTSDVDLFILTDNRRIWLTRTLVSLYFQALGMRRHGSLTADRFCLNHYLAGVREVDREKNLYKAMEYTRLRPAVYGQAIAQFQRNNGGWIRFFLPHANFDRSPVQAQSRAQRLLERLLGGAMGNFLERSLKRLEQPRIRQDDYTFVTEDELSFHPGSRHLTLLQKTFEGE